MIRFCLQPVASNSQESSLDISHDPDHKIPPALLCPPPKSTEIKTSQIFNQVGFLVGKKLPCSKVAYHGLLAAA